MKTQTKILIDRLVGLPLAWLINLMSRFLGQVLRRDHSIAPENVRTIVFSKYLGMRSMIQATPMIRSVRAAFPHARLIFVTGQSCRRMVERLEHIDQIITVDDRSVFRLVWTSARVLFQLMRARVDLYFDLELYSAYSSLIAQCSLARNRLGFYRESAQHKRGNYTHLMFFNTRIPIRYIYLPLARLAGCEPVRPDTLGLIRVEPADRQEVASRLATLGVGEVRRYLVINPNASDLLVERRWPTERFAQLIEQLIKRYDLPIILIGALADQDHVSSVLQQVQGHGARVLNLAGTLSLGGLLALLEGAACVVTNDTGPMHMAWALGARTVCLFGPVDPLHYGREGTGVELLHRPVYCSPCVHEVDLPPCNGNNICMHLIDVHTVLGAVERSLTKSGDRPGPKPLAVLLSDSFSQPLGRIVRGGV